MEKSLHFSGLHRTLRNFLALSLMLMTFVILPWKVVGQTYSIVEELDLTTKTYGTSSYNTSMVYGDWTIVNGANNNKGWAYFKMGGKSTTISNYNPCYIYTNAAIIEQVDKVTVHLPEGSLSKNGMSVNSWGLYVYSNSTMTSQIDYVAGGTITNSEGSFDFTPSTGVTWAANYYYKVSWDLANTTTTNGIICVDKITLYKENGGTPTTYTVTYDCNGGTSGCPSNMTDITAGTSITLADAPIKTDYTFDGWNDGSTTYQAGDSYTVNGDVTMTAQWTQNGGSTTTNVTYDFSSTNNFLTSYPSNTHPGTGNSNNLETFYYTNGDTFFASGTNRYFNSGYFMLGKADATLQLPTFDFDVEKIEITGRTGASSTVTQTYTLAIPQ